MKVSRSVFLKSCGLALLGARVDARTLVGGAAPVQNLAEAGGGRGRFRLQDATASLFQQHVNTAFVIRPTHSTRVRRLVLAKVTERPLMKDVEQFSLIFHAPAGEVVSQGTYPFQHSALGRFDLFIVPVNAANDRRATYQACFSRHLSARGSAACAPGFSTLRSRRT